MAKKPAKAASDDEEAKSPASAPKINTRIDARIIAFIEQYRHDMKEKTRFLPTTRDIIELALLEFAKQEGYTIDMRDE